MAEYGAALFNLLVHEVEDYAIFAMDLEGRVVHWNAGAERTLGFKADEVLNERLDLIFTPEDRELGLPALELERAHAFGRVDDERWHVRKNGSRFWAQGIVVPIRGSDGNVRGFGKIMRDRTDLKQLHEQLQARAEVLAQADEHKSRFIATLAHELRGPLAPLATVAHLLRHLEHRLPELGRIREVVERQTGQLQRLVEDVLDAARLSRGKLRLRTRPTDVADIATHAAEAARPLAEARDIELQVATPAQPVAIDADPDRMQQVVGNLLHNAVKFTPPGGRVFLTAESVGGEVLIRVVDTGVGISPELLPVIFDMFAQSSTRGLSSSSGLGIGLSLVRDLVTLHGGTVQARSDGEGKGSEFIVRLPGPADPSRPVVADAGPDPA